MSGRAIKVLVDIPATAGDLDALRAAVGCEIDYVDPPMEVARAIEPERLRGVDVLACTFPPTNFGEMDSLRWVQIASVGYTQLFGLDLPGRGVRATNARGCFDVPIGEWVVSMMVNLVRDLRQMIRNQEAGVWDRGAVFQREIRGMTVGLWGYGGIGRETARLVKQMGMGVHVLTRSGMIGARREVYTVPGTGDVEGVLADRVFKAGEEMEFLGGVDFLVVAMPLTKGTEGLIGERELSALKPTAYLLNPARGPIVQEQALLKALAERRIAGAALDTHYKYPLPAEHPLWGMENVILTPHIAGSSLSPHFKRRLWDIFATNVGRFARGEALLNELSAGQLSGE
jgi:phosphoglycerate dehydrogenase-like enzyme